jgi:hypothetical protein
MVERRPISERREHGSRMPRGLSARALADRPSEATAQAWARDALERCGARRAKSRARGSAAGRAALDEGGAEEAVNRTPVLQVDSALGRF